MCKFGFLFEFGRKLSYNFGSKFKSYKQLKQWD